MRELENIIEGKERAERRKNLIIKDAVVKDGRGWRQWRIYLGKWELRWRLRRLGK